MVITTENTIMTENTTKITTMEDIMMRRNTRVTTMEDMKNMETISMRRNTRITITMSMVTMVITITMMVLLQPKKENMNKLPNRQMVFEGQLLI